MLKQCNGNDKPRSIDSAPFCVPRTKTKLTVRSFSVVGTNGQNALLKNTAPIAMYASLHH